MAAVILVDPPNVAYPRGVWFALHPPGDYLSDVIRETGDFFEADILDELRSRIHGGVVIDAGAMIGNHTAYLAAFVPHSAIHAFEPLPANVELLRHNVAAYPTVRVHDVALSDAVGWATMTAEPGNLGHARFGEGAVVVERVPLDSYGFEDVSLLKVDVEGHEAAVLRGAADTIARCRPLICIEDWAGTGYASLLPDYQLAVSWKDAHQTYLYEPRHAKPRRA